VEDGYGAVVVVALKMGTLADIKPAVAVLNDYEDGDGVVEWWRQQR
jgi:hypothetical protein